MALSSVQSRVNIALFVNPPFHTTYHHKSQQISFNSLSRAALRDGRQQLHDPHYHGGEKGVVRMSGGPRNMTVCKEAQIVVPEEAPAPAEMGAWTSRAFLGDLGIDVADKNTTARLNKNRQRQRLAWKTQAAELDQSVGWTLSKEKMYDLASKVVTRWVHCAKPGADDRTYRIEAFPLRNSLDARLTEEQQRDRDAMVTSMALYLFHQCKGSKLQIEISEGEMPQGGRIELSRWPVLKEWQDEVDEALRSSRFRPTSIEFQGARDFAQRSLDGLLPGGVPINLLGFLADLNPAYLCTQTETGSQDSTSFTTSQRTLGSQFQSTEPYTKGFQSTGPPSEGQGSGTNPSSASASSGY
jgi:hypothetical protein